MTEHVRSGTRKARTAVARWARAGRSASVRKPEYPVKDPEEGRRVMCRATGKIKADAQVRKLQALEA